MTDPETRANGKLIRSHKDLDVYRRAVDAAMIVFELSRHFLREEIYALTSQIRRSSRSVAANIAEAWRKRRYEASFVSKLSDADAEAAETQVHIEFAVKCGYLSRSDGARIYREYESLVRMVVAIMTNSSKWVFSSARRMN